MIFTRGVSCQSRLHRDKLGGGHTHLMSFVLVTNHGFHRGKLGGEPTTASPSDTNA